MDRVELDYQMVLLQNGDETAFEVIYNETKRGLFSFILSFCKNYHTAEDIMQNTYIKLRTSVQSYTAGSNALAWIFTIAKNLALNDIAKRKREVYSDFEQGAVEYGEYTIDDKMTSPLLKIIEQNLNEAEQRIVLLYLVSGFKHREIADMLNKPLGTVLWTYRNAISKLRKVMEKENKDED
ncbi:MAG TPA: RNA polymerase sigma factor [Clostridia bacterium]|nr:RNA polymerase sigma factor [Clostridia bacterium]